MSLNNYWKKFHNFLGTASGRLSLTYLLIIMVMSIGFSIVFYNASSNQLGRQLPSDSYYQDNGWRLFRDDFDPILHNRIDEGRHDLLIRLLLLNLLTLLLGAAVSLWLAKETMRPIEESIEAQSQFISDASHELRTPLTAIQTSNEVALRKTGLKLADAKKLISQNTEDVIKLQAIADGLLQLAKTDSSNGVELTNVNVKEAINEAIAGVEPAAHEKDVKIQNHTTKATVVADSRKLVQVLTILLDNAIKYSPAKSSIVIDLCLHGRRIRLNVRDHGQGIAIADQPHIFKRFYQAERSRSKNVQKGYGLGLPIADKLTKQMHGTISFTSQPNKGSVFTVELHLSK